jgi:NAD(P)-dependent dehydrogenase (short-subunit alcohol dehydrogenase family)
VKAECEKHGVKAVTIKADMTLTSECKRVIEETIKQLGGIDIVIANAVRTSLLLPPSSSGVLR